MTPEEYLNHPDHIQDLAHRAFPKAMRDALLAVLEMHSGERSQWWCWVGEGKPDASLEFPISHEEVEASPNWELRESEWIECKECECGSGNGWPCRTRQTITKALGLDKKEDER